MKLVWKLAVPQICIVICVGLVSYAVIFSSFNRTREQYIRDAIDNRFQSITKEIEKSALDSVKQTSVFVSLPAVFQAYEIALSGDIYDSYSPESQAARELLRKELAPMLDNYAKMTGTKLDLHFHLPNGFSLVRLWREKNFFIDGEWVDMSDDLRLYRHTVVDANRTGEIALGIEPGSAGFAIRGVIPVIAPDGRQLGSAEVLHDFDSILDAATEKDNFYISLYANNELLDISVELLDQKKYPPKGDFMRVVEAKDSSVESLITPELLSAGKNGASYEHHGSMTLAAFPLVDYHGTQVGVIVCAMNAAVISDLENTAAIVLAIMLAGMAVIPTLALILRLRILVSRPINLVKAKIQDIAEDRADLSEQISNRQNDEIGELAKWFNTLTAKLDGILRERQAMAHWYGSILDAIPFMVSVQDLDMKWTFINKPLEKMLGKTREDVLGLPCKSWDIDICGTGNCAITCAKRGLKETRFLHGGVSYKVDVETISDLKGEIIGFIEIIQDISKLEHLAKQRAEAAAASQAKSDFLSHMSHEIRTPLNAIVGMTSIGMSADDPERMKHSLTRIADASKLLLGVINDILDMSKIEAGKLELSAEEFSFEKMLQQVVNVMRFRTDEKNQTFTVHIDKDIPKSFIGDAQRLAQVITNLIGNAVKFTPEYGSITVDSLLLEEENGVCTVQISVKDSGIGISPEQQTKLFQPFHQGESGTARKYGGTGLGLAISSNIVEMMGGRIWIDSELGKGSTFTFTVRLAKCEGGTNGLSEQGINLDHVPIPQDTAGLFIGKRILLAEDVEINREIVQILLEPTQVRIDCAENGREAVRMFRQSPDEYDMIFMDVQMPEMDGYEATSAIRALNTPKALTIPIIAMTANVFREDIEKCFTCGMDGHMGKPLDFNEVIAILRQYLLP
ncbi:MAG: response regulator [Oscillospiraceae bacterium]|jgi:signal transduction histidine kinase|nr:response regulator [Oscillospiraceae bacterium]